MFLIHKAAKGWKGMSPFSPSARFKPGPHLLANALPETLSKFSLGSLGCNLYISPYTPPPPNKNSSSSSTMRKEDRNGGGRISAPFGKVSFFLKEAGFLSHDPNKFWVISPWRRIYHSWPWLDEGIFLSHFYLTSLTVFFFFFFFLKKNTYTRYKQTCSLTAE